MIDFNLLNDMAPASFATVTGTVATTTLSAFAAATGQEVHGIAADPLFVSPATNDYQLSATSPAIDSATTFRA